MGTIIDAPGYSANEVYRIDETDPVEGAWSSASFDGAGVENEPHAQLADRTAFLRGRQDVDLGSIAALEAWAAEFTSHLQAVAPGAGSSAGYLASGGWFQLPIVDTSRGALIALVQFGFWSLAESFAHDSVTQGGSPIFVAWPIEFPNAILAPPLATSIYVAGSAAEGGGGNLVVSPISYSRAGANFTVDVPGGLLDAVAQLAGGFGWVAIGF